MVKELRRSDKALSKEETISLFKKCEYGFLSTNGENTYAYGVPLSYVYFANAIYFHCAKEGQKLDNINLDNNVSFCVVGNTKVIPERFTTHFESGIVFGSAEEVVGIEKETALVELIRKYSPAYIKEGMEYVKTAKDKTCVIKICIHHMTGKGTK